MNKEKQIEEMAIAIGEALGLTYEGERLPFSLHTRNYLAKALVNAGYGNLKEFAERLKQKSAYLGSVCFDAYKGHIEETLKEMGVEE